MKYTNQNTLIPNLQVITLNGFPNKIFYHKKLKNKCNTLTRKTKEDTVSTLPKIRTLQ